MNFTTYYIEHESGEYLTDQDAAEGRKMLEVTDCSECGGTTHEWSLDNPQQLPVCEDCYDSKPAQMESFFKVAFHGHFYYASLMEWDASEGEWEEISGIGSYETFIDAEHEAKFLADNSKFSYRNLGDPRADVDEILRIFDEQVKERKENK